MSGEANGYSRSWPAIAYHVWLRAWRASAVWYRRRRRRDRGGGVMTRVGVIGPEAADAVVPRPRGLADTSPPPRPAR